MGEDIKVRFVIPKDCRSENECSEEMQLAFTTCEQHCGGGLYCEWVHESQYTQPTGLTKKDVFVLAKFEGDLYQSLKATKCLIVGPRCLSCCLMEGAPIPSRPEPVFTVAMRGLHITASGLSKQQKEKIKKLVFWMGGLYYSDLTDDTTHLVSDTVLSDKYRTSVEKGIPVMSEGWIDAVWESSMRLNVNGASKDFDTHRLPAFANLNVTTSGLSRREKLPITKLVNENGGTFSGAFQSEITDVVVVNKDGIGTEKYKAALEYGKACVFPAWVAESAARGVALPFARYRALGASTSSPLAEHRLPDMSLNFSRITNSRPPSNFVDETRATDMSAMSGRTKLSQEPKRSTDNLVDKDVQAAFENFQVSSIKEAGPIFDGFCVWVTGMEGVSRERAAACVSRGGGVRYDGPHERVTHVVAGTRQAALHAAQALPNVPVLNPMWLIKSVAAARAIEESDFLVEVKPLTPKKSLARAEPSSPMSKRNLALLRRPLHLPPPEPAPAPRPPEPDHDELVNHYLSQPMPEPEKERSPEPAADVTSDMSKRQAVPDVTEDLQDLTEEVEQIFRGIKLEVQGLDEEAIAEIGAEVAAAGGVLVAAGAGGSHALVPLDFDPCDLVTKGAEPVTVFWVKDCLCQQELLPPQYYHRPVGVGGARVAQAPLGGVVASLSTYSGVERLFLDELAKLLGATTQLRFCRRNTANALASTHLICPSPVGDKYLGAVKWGLPAVTAQWLLACARAGARVSETAYLVGETVAPPSAEQGIAENNEQPPEVEQPEQPAQQNLGSEQTDKENVMQPPLDTNVPRRCSVTSKDQTPKSKPNGNANDDDEMSPASRYIAMARQGLLGGDTQDTPKHGDKQEGAVSTPPLEEALSTPNLRALSPTTRRRIQAVKRGEMPSDPIRTPNDPFLNKVPTPDSAFGAALRPGADRLSPESRKRLWTLVNDLPAKQQPDKEHTPLSEIRNRFLAQFNDSPNPPHNLVPRKLHLQDQADTPPAKLAKTSENQSAGAAVNTSNACDGTNSADSSKSAASAKSASSTLPSAVDAQLNRLSAALSGLTSQRQRRPTRDSISRLAVPAAPDMEPGPESQPNTVGWDDTTPAGAEESRACATHAPVPTLKRFMLSSNVDNREEIIAMIVHLGGCVSEGTELDPEATHLLCSAPGRSEKMLGSVAAGRWVLHPAYVARSRAQGQLLNEEEFEWGNPIASCLPPLSGVERTLARAAHRWRAARAAGRPGPFAGVVALLHVPAARRRLLARLVTAGDGLAPDDEPPYNNEDVTVCFADVKRFPISDRDTAWLVSRRIPVCPPVLLSAYLTDLPPPDPFEHCLPEFRPT